MRILINSRGASFFLPDLCSSSFFRLRWFSTLFASVDIFNPIPTLAVSRSRRALSRKRPMSCFAERHAEQSQQLARFVVAARAGDEGNVHALREIHLVRIDLGKHHLLGQTDRVVAVAVEALGIHAAEVANTR